MILSIDPSFRRTGTCSYDKFRTPSLQFHRFDFTGNLRKDFPGLFFQAQETVERICQTHNLLDYEKFVVEVPPPRASFSGGMWLLCTLILRQLQNTNQPIFLSPPSVGRNLFKNGKWKKSDGVKVAMKFRPKGHPRLTSDESDAFIQLLPFLPLDVQKKAGVLRLDWKYPLFERYSWQNLEDQEPAFRVETPLRTSRRLLKL